MEVESNIIASNRLKENSDHQIYDIKGKKDVISPSSTSQIANRKIDEMELENNSNNLAQEGERNPNQFRCQFAPRFIPRERRNNDIQRERRENEDQRVPPPLQNNVTYEFEEDEYGHYEHWNQEIN